jgi:hypothetical protein
MRRARLKITRSSELSIQVDALPWEVELYHAIHPAGQVEELGTVDLPDDDFAVGSVTSEYDRLVSRFGKDADSQVPFVTQVYGQGRQGIEKLAAAIEAAVNPPEGEAPAPVVAETPATPDPLAS